VCKLLLIVTALDAPTWLSMIDKLWNKQETEQDSFTLRAALCRMNRLALETPGSAGIAVSFSRYVSLVKQLLFDIYNVYFEYIIVCRWVTSFIGRIIDGALCSTSTHRCKGAIKRPIALAFLKRYPKNERISSY